MRIRVQQPGARGPREEEPGQQLARAVTLLRRAVRDHLRQRGPVHPLADQHLLALVHDIRDDHVIVVHEGVRVAALRLRLQLVVQLLRDPVAQLLDQRLDVHAGDQRAQQPGEAAQLFEVRQQRLPGARVLDLDRHRAAVAPHRPVHLPDRGGRGGLLLELLEQVPPVLAEPLGQHRRTVPAGSGGAASWSLVSAAR
ncbi:hypothetical protein GCM10020254_32150 [Streptomyces goshikiensis]